jgi:hypothetical protein
MSVIDRADLAAWIDGAAFVEIPCGPIAARITKTEARELATMLGEHDWAFELIELGDGGIRLYPSEVGT